MLLLSITQGCTRLEDITQAAPYPKGPLTLPLSFVTWNTAKGKESSPQKVAQAIHHLTQENSTLVVLQEAVPAMLTHKGYGAHFARSFAWFWQNHASGVAQISPTRPLFVRAITTTHKEIGSTPKMAMAALYPVLQQGKKTTLLVITIHGLNFEWSGEGLAAQMKEIQSVIDQHHGPTVIAGDFNTWSHQRLAIVKEALSAFTEVPVDGPRRTAGFFIRLAGGSPDLPLDRIFVRGLEVRGKARTLENHLSDHPALSVTLALP